MNTMRHAIPFFVLAVSALFLGAAEPAYTQTYGPYLKVNGGMNFVADNDIRLGGTDGTLSLDTGYRVDGVLGYELNRWLAIEIEGGWADNSVNKLTVGGTRLHLDRDSALTQIPLLANLVVRYENESGLVPYLGAGAGGVMSTLKLSDEDSNDTVFAWQAKAGIIYQITERAWFDAGYKLLSTAEQDYRFHGEKFKTKELFNHFIGVSVIWKF